MPLHCCRSCCRNLELLVCRFRLLERGGIDEPVLPDGHITVDLVSATIEALICDDRGDHHDDVRWSDCELAGKLCNLYQVMRASTQ